MDESRKKINRFYSASFFLIAILILVFMGVLLYMGYSSQLMIKKQSPQIRTIGLIELEITTAHLWLEEVLSGDRGEDIQAVYSHFEEANKYASILLDGGKVDEMQVYLVEDSTVRSKIEAVQLGIDSLFKLSGQRFLELGETQAGTETDKIYDAVFGQFIQIAKISERALIQQQQKNTRTFIYIQKTLIFSVITFSIIVLAFFFWFERFKINKQKQLVQSDKELSQSEGRWQYALESSGDGVWNWNAQTNEVFFSKRWKEMLGYKDDEISNNLNEWEKLIHPEEKEKNQAVLNKFLKGETDFINLEHRLLCKDGTYKWILSRGKIIERLPDNKPLRIIGTHIDLTERKQVEEALKIEKEFSEKIIDTSTAIIVGLDKDHLIQLFNKGAEKITGYSKAEVIGKDWFQIFFPEELLDEMNNVWENAWGVQSHSYENPILVKSGEERMISWQATGIYDGEDSSKHLLISIGEDITDRKKAEIMLQDEKEQKKLILDLVGNPIFMKDNDHRIIFANPAFCNIFGLEENNVIGKTLAEEVPENERKQFLQVDRNVLDTGIPDVREEELTSGGITNTLITRKVRFIDESGNRFLVGSISDITERKKAEGIIKKHQEQLEELIKERTLKLEEKNETLERTNKAFVGRELRMVELKEEIEKLKNPSTGSV